GVRIEFTGSSLPMNHPKVVGIINSWVKGFKEKPNFDNVSTHPDFFKRINFLKKKGYLIIGTTPNVNAIDLFSVDLSKEKKVIVFGTETTGLCKEKQKLMELMIKIPMNPPTSFFTISVIAPIICFETIRQKKHFEI
ncbi:MAG: TrmH family RNA methyltransferase, partial [archaeon]